MNRLARALTLTSQIPTNAAASLLFFSSELIRQARIAERERSRRVYERNSSVISDFCMFMPLAEVKKFTVVDRSADMATWENTINTGSQQLQNAIILVVNWKSPREPFRVEIFEGHHRLLRLEELGATIVPVVIQMVRISENKDLDDIGDDGETPTYGREAFDKEGKRLTIPSILFQRPGDLRSHQVIASDLRLPVELVGELPLASVWLRKWPMDKDGTTTREAISLYVHDVLSVMVYSGKWKETGKNPQDRLFSVPNQVNAQPKKTSDDRWELVSGWLNQLVLGSSKGLTRNDISSHVDQAVTEMVMNGEWEPSGAGTTARLAIHKASGNADVKTHDSPESPSSPASPSSSPTRVPDLEFGVVPIAGDEQGVMPMTDTEDDDEQEDDSGDSKRATQGSKSSRKRGREEKQASKQSKSSKATKEQRPKSTQTSASAQAFPQQLLQVEPLEQARLVCSLPRGTTEAQLRALFCALHMPASIGTPVVRKLLQYDSDAIPQHAQVLRQHTLSSKAALEALQQQLRTISSVAVRHKMPALFAQLTSLRGLQPESEVFLTLLSPSWQLLLQPTYSQRDLWAAMREQFLNADNVAQTTQVVCLLLSRVSRG